LRLPMVESDRKGDVCIRHQGHVRDEAGAAEWNALFVPEGERLWPLKQELVIVEIKLQPGLGFAVTGRIG
jgi:hypothetical protein